MERAPRHRRSLDILSVKEAKLSASEVNDVEVGRGDADLRQSNLFTVCFVDIHFLLMHSWLNKLID